MLFCGPAGFGSAFNSFFLRALTRRGKRGRCFVLNRADENTARFFFHRASNITPKVGCQELDELYTTARIEIEMSLLQDGSERNKAAKYANSASRRSFLPVWNRLCRSSAGHRRLALVTARSPPAGAGHRQPALVTAGQRPRSPVVPP